MKQECHPTVNENLQSINDAISGSGNNNNNNNNSNNDSNDDLVDSEYIDNSYSSLNTDEPNDDHKHLLSKTHPALLDGITVNVNEHNTKTTTQSKTDLNDKNSSIHKKNKQTKQHNLPYSKPPQIYPCDEQGFPLWCTMCQSIKQPRTHHSSHLNRCIWKFDHYCLWIGQVIGGANYKVFIQYAFSIVIFLSIMFFSIVSLYLPHYNNNKLNEKYIKGNIITVIIITGPFLTFSVMLFLQHCYYTIMNITSIESIQRKSLQQNREFISVLLENNKRYVVECPYSIQKRNYWRRGSILYNIKQQIGPHWYLWFFPTANHEEDQDYKLGEYYLSWIKKQVEIFENSNNNDTSCGSVAYSDTNDSSNNNENDIEKDSNNGFIIDRIYVQGDFL
ncbi:uncharacterized protein SCODWIG_01008 [Saccharomycodes ludwigii]|uniref:Palmitoyltransferase n=1 Tax=Saccharomycodes ludwigii TaxID=36035 RepID=A0A376B3K5_9ASCO|nr:hypothetical protein SCDLUD_004921 [Saccharomycodes ludwigii]KAH3899477.1 hypothetical protein SCDLUD_004921 [Saccharomycodes ludwigii]SSD59247.1 uncharacterized protein SCODWIG_01008 [Saccharomycodes ludwigii]